MEKQTPDANAAPRKRLGRPPKATNTQEQDAIEEVDSPQPEDRMSSPTNRRRSTRKKITKFDVLDVLNKSRKTHKIQIEARIDSNTPTTSSAAQSPAPTTPDINRIIAPRSSLPAAPPPILPTLELFTKPKPTPSLIVAQVSSDSSQALQKAPKKRGRPRKTQAVETTTALDTNPSTSRAAINLQLESTDSDETLKGFPSLDDGSNSNSSELTLITPIEIIEEDVITVLTSDEEDSDSQIIFVDIESAEAAVDAEENEDEQSTEEQQSFKLIFSKEQQDISISPIEDPQDAETESQIITEVVDEPPELWLNEDEMAEEQPEQSPEEPNTQPQSSTTVESEPRKKSFIELMQKVILEKQQAEEQQMKDAELAKERKLEQERKMEKEEMLKKQQQLEKEKLELEEKQLREQLERQLKLELEEKLKRKEELEKELLARQKKLELEEQKKREQELAKEKLERQRKLELEEKLKKEQELAKEKLERQKKMELEEKLKRAKELELEKERKLERDRKLEEEKQLAERMQLEKERLEVLKMLEETEKLQKETKLQQEKKAKEKEKREEEKRLAVERKFEREKKKLAKELEEKRKREAKQEKRKLEQEKKLQKELKKDKLKKPETEEKMEIPTTANTPEKQTNVINLPVSKQLLSDTLSCLLKESIDTGKIIAAHEMKASDDIESKSQESTEKTLQDIPQLESKDESTPETNPTTVLDDQLLAEAKATPLPRSESPEPPEIIAEPPEIIAEPPQPQLPPIEKKKDERPSTSTGSMSFKECDALFKVLDKAHTKLLNEQKAKKQKRKANKKQAAQQKSAQTMTEDLHKELTTPPAADKRRALSPEPETKPSNNSKKSNSKKPPRKSGPTKQPSQDSLDSNSMHELPNTSLPATPSTEQEPPDQFDDIAKFIMDGEKLLERDYKQDDEEEQQQLTAAGGEDEFAERVANMETPATTPSPSPANSSEDLSSGVRRSHRIKQKPQGTKSSLGRGSSSLVQTPAISMEQQLSELATIDAINDQFLRQEGLQTFQTLRDNYYRCARQVSKENAEMQCDCFVTGDEESMGQVRCCGDGCINRMLMIECGPLCTNGDRCTNKRFQQHQGWPCRVFRTEKKGCGITAELQMPSGQFIMEYVGEVIDSEEFERRQHLYSEDRNRHYYFMALRGDSIIDATSKGNISRYINHSCDPNAETQKWTVNGELRIGFFSLKTIMPGEEITFDYQYQRYGRDAQRCYCESANCRGWIGNEPESDGGEQLDTDTDSEPDELQEQMQDQKLKLPKSAKAKKQQKLAASRGKQRKDQPKPKDREYKAGRWLRPSGGPRAPRNHADQLEDPDVLEQLTLLSGSGLKNQLDTLRFSRCMVRAKLLETRLQLLGVLTRGELPCRRLFLDYHGLRLLHAWISESGSDKQLRLALLEALESLPIPNKTMLNESRVFQSVELWSKNVFEPQDEAAALPEPDPESDGVQQRIMALLLKWNGLPEIFRIPKRERIEQMKEHEREADRQQQLDKSSSASLMLSSDRYRQDRFRRDTTSRYEKPKPPSRMSGNNTICTITTQPQEIASGSKADPRRRSEVDPRRAAISKELRRSLFEKKVAQDEAEKRVGSEDWREHERRCEYFGLDVNTDPKMLPFCQNTETNEWFNVDNVPVPAPPRCGDNTEPPSPKSGDDVEYKLPKGVDPLPLSWHFNVTPGGDVYYFNIRDRIPQWEPPTPEQRLQPLVDEPIEPPLSDQPPLDDLVNIDIEYVGTLSEQSLRQYIEAKVKERKEARRKRLVSVRTISPRREEDRIYNQQESRKYKENKEKIRRRKEIYRRTRTDSNTAEQPAGPSSDSLPIHSYLYSSDEDTNTESSLPPIDPLVVNLPDSSLPSCSSETESVSSVKRKHATSEGHKKHRDSKRKTPTTRDSNEKFHFEISGHVADFLRPYRQDTCHLGRITSDEDYKFLIKRLSHHITTKEMRYCEVTGNPLACTESVKHKSYEFIKQYMRKKGPVYKKPVDRPD